MNNSNGKKNNKGKLWNLYVANFAYGGNGSVAMELPSMRTWWGKNLLALKNDKRLGPIHSRTYSDTPITMTRNRAVIDALESKADFILMLDSDNHPDMYLGHDLEAEPFLKSSLDFLIENYSDGPSVVGAPYCGPPPHPIKGGEENVYVFHWEKTESDNPNAGFKLMPYTRNHAMIMRGIQPCGALPTGCILFDMRAFGLTEPREFERERWRGWFYYEWSDRYASQKDSTEDVTATRDMGLAGVKLFCQWNSWAGHMKPKMVGRPQALCADQVTSRFRCAVEEGIESTHRLIDLTPMETATENVAELSKKRSLGLYANCELNNGHESLQPQ